MLAFIIVGGLAALVAYTYFGHQLVSSAEAKKLIASGDVKKVVDVRTKFEYKAGHYPGAVHIPVGTINKQTTQGLPKSGLLVYCNTGQRARFAAEKLSSMGFNDVYYIADSYTILR